MSLSNSITVNYYERTNGGSTTRAVYKLDDKIYTSDLTSYGAGVYGAQSEAITPLYYSPTIGGLNNIRSCTLLCGTYLIDGFTADDIPQQWLTIDTLTCPNRVSIDINRPELHSGWGFTERQTDAGDDTFKGTLTLQDPSQDYSTTLNDEEPYLEMFKIAETEDGPNTQIDWSRVLPFLKSTPVLPRIPQLQLVHVYNTDPQDYVNPTEEAGALSTLNPVLLANEVLGQELTQPEYTFQYTRIHTDHGMIVAAPAEPAEDAAAIPKLTVYNCKSFDGMYVENLYFWNTASAPIANIPNNNRSPAMANEKLQVIVNGFPLLPMDGIVQEAEKMLYQTRCKGSINVPMALYLSGLATSPNNRVLDAVTAPFGSELSVTAVHVGATIDRLQIQHQRTWGEFAHQQQPFTLALMAEVKHEFTAPTDGDLTKVVVAF
jgi:hypothetical protein